MLSRPTTLLASAAVIVMFSLLTMLYLSVLGDVLFEPDSGPLARLCATDNCRVARSLVVRMAPHPTPLAATTALRQGANAMATLSSH